MVTFTSAWSVGSGLHDLGNIQQLLRDFAVPLGATPSVSFVCHSFIDLQGMPCPVVHHVSAASRAVTVIEKFALGNS